MWKDLVDYPSYQISEDGFVMNKKTGRILKQYIDDVGYYQFTVCNNGIIKKLRTHRELAKAFIPNLDNYDIVDHIDRDRINNDISNLRWVSRYTNNTNKEQISSTNQRHIYDTGSNTFRVLIKRPNKKIDKSFKTLEEAIAFRDSVISQFQ